MVEDRRKAPDQTLIDPNSVERPFHIEGVLASGGMALVVNDSVILSSKRESKGGTEMLMVTRKRGVPIGNIDFFSRPAYLIGDQNGFETFSWGIRKNRPDRHIIFIGRDGLKVVCLNVRRGQGIKIRIEAPVEIQTEAIDWSDDFAAILAERQRKASVK